jgi:shikimate kinase
MRYDESEICETERNGMRIFLIGFMGTGKTTVGQALSAALGFELCDSDEEIVRREGRSIPEIFADEGELYFRRVESEVLAELAERPQTVITTGGGAVLSAANRELMAKSGLVVCLQATVDEIVRRATIDNSKRPLLRMGQESVRERVERLLREREGLYDFAELVVDTTGKDVSQITAEIVHHLSDRLP